MTDIPAWLTWGSIAGFIGLATFIWKFTDSIINWRKKPKLNIEFFSIWNGRWVGLDNNRIVKFHCIHIKNDGKTTAKRCVALLKILEKPESVTNIDQNIDYKLHWADQDYSYKTDEPEPIDIGAESRRLDVFFSEPINLSIPSSGTSSSSGDSVYASGNTAGIIMPPLSPSTYVVRAHRTHFTATGYSGGTSSGNLKSWIAIPIALKNPTINQAYLPKGTYRVKIKIDCENGKGIEKKFDIVISANGQNNSLNEVS